MDLTACISHCRAVQSSYSKIFSGVPNEFSFTSDGKQLLFLSSFGASANSLYSIDLVENNKKWDKMLGPTPQQQLSRSEQLLQERMRTFSRGITKYEYMADCDSIFVQDGTNCSVLRRQGAVSSTFPSLPNAVDFQLCPGSTSLAACVCDGDIWLLDANKGEKHKLTHTSDLRNQRKVSAGQPAFVTQEEFDRFTGYWWQPNAGENGKYRILYEEVDETDVRVVHTFNPSSQSIENYNYPFPGTKNATSTLKLLKFSFPNGELKVKIKSLSSDLRDLFPHFEYLTRVGWAPDGINFWVQLLDRCQKHLETVMFPLAVFGKKGSTILPQPLWKEEEPHWINVSNIMDFCPTDSEGSVRFLFSSEASGYRHLYWAETKLCPESSPPAPLPLATPLTRGNWIVLDSDVSTNQKENVLFFMGNASSCLDKHLYAVQLNAALPCAKPLQLTQSGYYHAAVDMNTECTKFVDTYSNSMQGPTVAVFSISYQPLTATQLCVIWEPIALPLGYCPPQYFSLQCETGEELHGCIFPPANLTSGHKYPTIHFIYGGPHFQMVTRSVSRYISKIQTWTEKGFAVIIADNRGSNNRGTRFESAIAEQFGQVEVEDQVLALKTAAQRVNYIDLNRVAVTGWSYGGYMSLMCLAKAPSVYKLAVAGAAVVDWMSYDTGYTERYLGVPPEAEEAYDQSSVLTYLQQLPTEPNRLLIVHGMNDENVLFTHTSVLLDNLVKFGKPYALQVFTGERHGIRSSQAAIHCDATVLLFFLQYL